MIEERHNLLQKGKIHCHLGYGSFVTVNQIMMTTAEFVWRPLQPRSKIALFEQLLRQQLSSVQKITALGTTSRTTYDLWNVNSVRWWCLNIVIDEREVYYLKSEVITFDVEFYLFPWIVHSWLHLHFLLAFIYILSSSASCLFLIVELNPQIITFYGKVHHFPSWISVMARLGIVHF